MSAESDSMESEQLFLCSEERTDEDAPDARAGEEAVEAENVAEEDIVSAVRFRMVSPTDLSQCHALEHSSYPPDEGASLQKLQYRQHHAAPFFRCAVLQDSTRKSGQKIIGYITATRCHNFSESSMAVHDPTGSLLAIHSIVVAEGYRRRGIASAMIRDYVATIKSMDYLKYGLDKLVLMAKAPKLAFYVRSGFKVLKVSDIVHGTDLWYHCELDLSVDGTGTRGHYSCWILDAFAALGDKGTGNPAAVVLLSNSCPVDARGDVADHIMQAYDAEEHEKVRWMKIVAKEFNLSATAFIWEYVDPRPLTTVSDSADGSVNGDGGNGDGGGGDGEPETLPAATKTTLLLDDGSAHYSIRFYTCDGTEIDLCGHAALASASVVFQILATHGKKRDDMAVTFHAKHNVVLRAKPASTGSAIILGNTSIKIAMDFPWRALREIETPVDRSAVLSMLREGFKMSDTAENILFMGLDEKGEDVLIELTTDAFMSLDVTAMAGGGIDYGALTKWDGYTRGLILCCRAPKEYGEKDDSSVSSTASSSTSTGPIDFMSRFFGPKAGVDEDPVTGSAHCVLAPYFGVKLSKTKLVGRQMSQRGGIIECVLKKTSNEGSGAAAAGNKKRVGIVGTVVNAMSGTLYI